MSSRDDRPDAPLPDEELTSDPEGASTHEGDAVAPPDAAPGVASPQGPAATDDDEFLDAPVVAESASDREEATIALGVDDEHAHADPADPDDVGAGPAEAYGVGADPADDDDLGAEVTEADDVGADPAVADPAGAQDLSAGAQTAAQPRGAGWVVVVVLVILLALLGALYVTTRGSDVPAYTAYGEETSHAELREQLDGLVEPDVLDTLGEEDAPPEAQTRLAQAISTVITLDVLGHAAEEEGIEVTEAQVDEQLEEVVATGFNGDQAAFDAQLAQQGMTTETVRASFRTALLAEALIADEVPAVTEEDVRAAYDAQFNLPTVSHILTETEEEAQAAKDRIDAGEDFATVASEVSIDSSAAQGGELGPLSPGQFVPEFEEAALELDTGEVSDPVQSQFGYHVITVDEPAPFEEVSGQIQQGLEQQGMGEAFTALAERVEAEAEITVDPDLGTWTGLTGGGLVPPSTPTQDPADIPPSPQE